MAELPEEAPPETSGPPEPPLPVEEDEPFEEPTVVYDDEYAQ